MQTNPESAAVEAVAWDYSPEHRIAVTDGKGGVTMTLNGHGAPAGISLYHGDYVSELQSALDALRGEVERRKQAFYEIEARWVDQLERANAAKRRAGEAISKLNAIELMAREAGFAEGIGDIEGKDLAALKAMFIRLADQLEDARAALTKESP